MFKKFDPHESIEGAIVLNVYDDYGNWLINQPFDPRTQQPILTEQQAEEIADFLLNPPTVNKPTYEALEKRLEVTENELLIAMGVI